MLPSPVTFTIPSIYDDTVLDCRLYFPSGDDELRSSKEWRKKAAVIGHPYGPLGGSFDDPVVELVVKVLLDQEYTVGTFNFRGAGGSRGRTSWTSKPETQDYISFVAFMIYFMHNLSYAPIRHPLTVRSADSFEFHNLSPIPSTTMAMGHLGMNNNNDINSCSPSEISSPSMTSLAGGLSEGTSSQDKLSNLTPLLVLGGYSYGALVTTRLPSLDLLIRQFQTPGEGSAASEIQLRAFQLAKQQNEAFACRLAAIETLASENAILDQRGRGLHTPRHASGSSSIRMGGEETDPTIRRSSHESYRSFSLDTPERLRRSMDRVRSIGRHNQGHKASPGRHASLPSTAFQDLKKNDITDPSVPVQFSQDENKSNENKNPTLDLGQVKVAYLLISPLQGIINNLATLWTTPNFSSKSRSTKVSNMSEEEKKLVVSDTLAIFGNEDIFTSSKKLVSWGQRLRDAPNSRFQYLEVSGAGHFWHEAGVATKMKEAITSFVGKLGLVR